MGSSILYEYCSLLYFLILKIKVVIFNDVQNFNGSLNVLASFLLNFIILINSGEKNKIE